MGFFNGRNLLWVDSSLVSLCFGQKSVSLSMAVEFIYGRNHWHADSMIRRCQIKECPRALHSLDQLSLAVSSVSEQNLCFFNPQFVESSPSSVFALTMNNVSCMCTFYDYCIYISICAARLNKSPSCSINFAFSIFLCSCHNSCFSFIKWQKICKLNSGRNNTNNIIKLNENLNQGHLTQVVYE